MAVGYGRRIRRLLVDAACGKTVTFPTTVFVSLHTANPNDDGQTAGEVGAGVGYARQQITTANWTAAPNPALDGDAVSASAIAVTFGPNTTTNWGTITHLGFWDHVSNTVEANFIGRAALNPATAITVGNSLSFAIGAITLTADST
jgi:hypothetical protein